MARPYEWMTPEARYMRFDRDREKFYIVVNAHTRDEEKSEVPVDDSVCREFARLVKEAEELRMVQMGGHRWI